MQWNKRVADGTVRGMISRRQYTSGGPTLFGEREKKKKEKKSNKVEEINYLEMLSRSE